MTEQAVLQDARRYLAMLHKRRAIVVTCLALSLATAVLYNYTTRPVYQATTQILIDRDTPDVLPNKELVELVQGGMDYYQTQYQLLKGRTLAERAVERLKLQTHPELATGPMMNPWERVRGFFGLHPSAVVDPSGMPLSPAAAAFRSRIQVEPVTGSRLVNLHFRAYDPRVAADAVNALAQLYIEQSLELRFTTSTEATGWLSDRLKEQQAKVEAAEQALQEYREREGLVGQESREGLVDQKLGTLNGAVLEARTERIAKETLYKQIASLGPGQIESFALVLGSGPVQALKTELNALQKEEAQLADSLGDRHPEMLRVRGQIRATEEKIRAEMRNVTRAAESDYRTALARESRLAGEPRGGEGRGPGHEPQVDGVPGEAARGRYQPPALPGPADEDQADRARDRAQDHEHPRGREGRDAARAGAPAQDAQLPGGGGPGAAAGDRPGARLRAHGQHVQDARGRARAASSCRSWAWCRTWGSSRRRAPERAARIS